MNGNLTVDLAESIRSFGEAVSRITKENPGIAALSIVTAAVVIIVALWFRYLTVKEREKTKRYCNLNGMRTESRQGAGERLQEEGGET